MDQKNDPRFFFSPTADFGPDMCDVYVRCGTCGNVNPSCQFIQFGPPAHGVFCPDCWAEIREVTREGYNWINSREP